MYLLPLALSSSPSYFLFLIFLFSFFSFVLMLHILLCLLTSSFSSLSFSLPFSVLFYHLLLLLLFSSSSSSSSFHSLHFFFILYLLLLLLLLSSLSPFFFIFSEVDTVCTGMHVQASFAVSKPVSGFLKPSCQNNYSFGSFICCHLFCLSHNCIHCPLDMIFSLVPLILIIMV